MDTIYLLEKLSRELKGKPVYKTLNRIISGKVDDFECLKGLFSLGTHVCIELEKGHIEYQSVLHIVYQKIYSIIEELYPV